MTYQVKEIYYTLQGEGARTGRAAVFLRFAGCNLWSGREEDRATATCKFCDTDFVGTDGPGGGKFNNVDDLAAAVRRAMARRGCALRRLHRRQPSLQLDAPAIEALHARGFEVGIETNGTIAPPPGIDWICVSPKARADLLVKAGDELKLIYPQDGGEPERYASLRFRHFYLQPMDGPAREKNTRLATEYCLQHPQWRLSLQTHKLIGIP